MHRKPFIGMMLSFDFWGNIALYTMIGCGFAIYASYDSDNWEYLVPIITISVIAILIMLLRYTIIRRFFSVCTVIAVPAHCAGGNIMKYEYEWEGLFYVKFGRVSPRLLIDRWSAGRSLPVAIDPKHPQRAKLVDSYYPLWVRIPTAPWVMRKKS